jgi:hypothetical protein
LEEVEFLVTADGSPTACFVKKGLKTEFMHSLEGAFSETLYVYKPILDHAFEHSYTHYNCFVLGLGLGYIECLIASFALKNKIKHVSIESYESHPELRSFFLNFIKSQKPQSEKEKTFFLFYDQILSSFSSKEDFSSLEIKHFLLNLYEENKWALENEFEFQFKKENHINLLFFDAFSASEGQELWELNSLSTLLKYPSIRQEAIFSTYAARSSLKKSLKGNGFTLLKRKGFAHKRECVFAYRESL